MSEAREFGRTLSGNYRGVFFTTFKVRFVGLTADFLNFFNPLPFCFVKDGQVYWRRSD